jgi:undecaprenyl-diphosphatase
MSRSGMTIAGGMLAGLTRSDAARFSFLLATPILLGSGLKKLYDLYSLGITDTLGMPLIIGAVAAFVAGLAAIHLLLLIVRRTPLTVFVVYRLAVAALVLALV